MTSNSTGCGSNDGSDSLSGDAEIDFESLWQWPSSHGTGLTPGADAGTGTAIGLTPGGRIGLVGLGAGLGLGLGLGHGQGQGMSSSMDVKVVQDGTLPMYGMSSAEFGGI